MIDFPPPASLIVCIETMPDHPPGVHMLTMETLKKLGRIAADYEAQEKHRLEFEASLAAERKDLKAMPSLPENEVGVLVTFERDCAPEKKP